MLYLSNAPLIATLEKHSILKTSKQVSINRWQSILLREGSFILTFKTQFYEGKVAHADHFQMSHQVFDKYTLWKGLNSMPLAIRPIC